jgi:hypothetical protein
MDCESGQCYGGPGGEIVSDGGRCVSFGITAAGSQLAVADAAYSHNEG